MALKIATWRWLALMVMMSAAVSVVRAAETPIDPLVKQREASYWVTRIQQAAQHQNYSGVFVYQRDATLQSSQISHYADLLNNEYERVETLDGKPRQFVRHNREVRTLRPDTQTILLERRDLKDSFPSLISTNKAEILDSYELRKLGVERFAANDCQVLALEPRDGDRYGYRLWVERKTGLLLRAQTLDDKGKVLEQIAFSRVQIGVPTDKNRIMAPLSETAGWKVTEVQEASVNLAEMGWNVSSPLKGFVKLREVKRPTLLEGGGPGHTGNMYQAVFSDGLADLSVIVEPVVNRNARREGVASVGATNLLTRRQGDFWVTVVGEVPASVVKQFSSSVEQKSTK
ncbi:MAG: MucB/RseB C-terminal domain-containing protein [Candidatus Protistobacter heckmanni]|nr:MucB/RseB C-terminal domain-containing protein [Candidatus Protistobacter heckmanni]